MKKTLLFLLSVLSTVAMAQSFSVTPKYGCPGVTQTVTIIFTTPIAITSYDVSLSISDGSTVLKTFTQSYTTGIPASGSGSIIITDVPFAGVTNNTVCTVVGTITAQTFIGGVPYAVNQNYTVQYPPTLSIGGTTALSVSTPLDGYTVRYYLGTDYATVINSSLDGTYTPTQTGDYSADAYDPVTGCASQSYSNIVNIVVSAISDAQQLNVSVYPNPMVNSVTVAADNMNVSYSISNVSGIAVKAGSIDNVGAISVDDLQAGMYILTIKDQSGKSSAFTLVK